MKAKSWIAVLVAASLTVGVLAGCAIEPQLTDEPLKGTTIADFTKGASEAVFESDGWSNGSVFNVVWTKENVTYGKDAMHLGITAEERTVYVDDKETTYSYTAGEARTTLHYGYGDFEVSMKPAAKAGTASTFFTCTGPYDTGLDGNPQHHDEIDIEFLGKDTTKVQFNYFVNAQGGHEHMYDLGFDASKEYHTYGFRWEEKAITWFVDGEPVYKVEQDAANPVLPSAPGRILMNYWCGTKDAEGWMGKYEGPKGETADYQWVKSSATGVDLTPKEPEVPGDKFEGNWDEVTASDLTFTSADPSYTISKEEGATHVTYTEVKGQSYLNINAPITEAAAGKNWLHLTITNNAETAAQVRVNVIDDALANNPKNKSSNLRAYMDGESVRTDLEWGGSFFEIAAGKTVEAEVYFGGTPDSLELMFDSSRNDNDPHAGDLTFTAVKFAKQGDVEAVTPSGTPDTPGTDAPTSGDLTLEVNDTELTFAGNVTDGYGVNANDAEHSLTVTYTAITGATYLNIWADVSAIARTKNVFSVKVTNNGEATLTFRVDIESVTAHENNNVCCNDSATQDGEGVYTDKDYGGSTFSIEAGKSAVCQVTYLTAEGPTNLKLYFDSSTYGDTAVHAGNVVLSELAFSGEGTYTPSEPAEPEIPAGTPAELSFASSDGYTVDPNGTAATSFNVTYSDIGGQTYGNIQANVAELAKNNDTLTLTIINNGTESVRVRVDVNGTKTVTVGDNKQMSACNVSATNKGGSDLYTDLTWGGTFITVAAGEEVTLVITYNEALEQGPVGNILVYLDSSRNDTDTHSGSVTLKDFIFTSSTASED